ncbi:uncharacterized protein LOC143074094 [Mytilus galloprovincialis]|uniref:uncharacterized protein LOC143074094 n=1 Tax=Mytilus galloprovincialis TaxID=29158 RepID=UPI003F7B941C
MDMSQNLCTALCKWFLLWIILLKSSSVVGERVWMDDETMCKKKTAIFVYDGKPFFIQAKEGNKDDPPKIYDCELIVGPFDENRSLVVTFISFYIKTCVVKVTISEGISSTMMHEKSLKTLDCNTKGKAKDQSFRLSKENTYLRFYLKTDNPNDLRYNFILNITSVPLKPEDDSQLSVGVKIGIAIISVIAFVLIVYFVFKIVKLRMSIKEDFDVSPSASNLYNLPGSNATNVNAYVPVPGKEPAARQIREPDPEIYYEFSPSQTPVRENGSTDPKTPEILPPTYEEALENSVPLTETDRLNAEYVNYNTENS